MKTTAPARHRLSKFALCTILAFLGASPMPAALAAGDADLEQGLILAMTLDKAKQERPNDSGVPIQAYKKQGLISFKPTKREDYTDYYVLKKPATFLGQKLIVIEEEYMIKFVGCCVDEGLGVFVETVGPTDALKALAAENRCEYKEGEEVRQDIAGLSPAIAPSGHFGHLSCRTQSIFR